MLSCKRNVLEYYLVPSWPRLPIRGSCIVGVHASQISAISLKLWRQKLLHFQASQHICRCPPSVMVLFKPYPKGASGKTSNDSLCILSCKQLVSAKKRGFSICICGRRVGRSEFLLPYPFSIHISFHPDRYANFPISAIWLKPIKDSLIWCVPNWYYQCYKQTHTVS